jgi:hypothetical protein
MDDDSADSKLSKLAPPEDDDDVQPDPDEEWYQSGCGGDCPVADWYFAAQRAAAPPATANGM